MANTYFINSVLVLSSIFVATVHCENSTNVTNIGVSMSTSYEVKTTQLPKQLATSKPLLQTQSITQFSTNAGQNVLPSSQQSNLESLSQNFIATSSRHPWKTTSSIRLSFTTISQAPKQIYSSKMSDISFSTVFQEVSQSQTASQQPCSTTSQFENTMSLSTAFGNDKSESTINMNPTSFSSLSFSTKISTALVSTIAPSIFSSGLKKMTSSFFPLSSNGKSVVKTPVIPAVNGTTVVSSSRYELQINQTSTRQISTVFGSIRTSPSFWVKSSPTQSFTPISKIAVSSSYSASSNIFFSPGNEKETETFNTFLSTTFAFTSEVARATTSMYKQFVTSSKQFQPRSTPIQPSPTGSTRIPQVASSNVIPSYDYKYTVTMEVEGKCKVLDAEKNKKEFFNNIRAQLEKDFGDVVIDENYKCGSVIFNYTVNSSLNPSKFKEDLEKNTNITFEVSGATFTRVKENIVVIEYARFSSSSPIVTQTPTSTKSPDNKKNLTVLYATIFSVVGFVVVVIIIVIIIGCRKNGNVMRSKRSYELGRFDHTSASKTALNMYGEEPIIKDATDSESKPDEDLSPTWDIPKLEINDEKSVLNASKATGVENKALENDEE